MESRLARSRSATQPRGRSISALSRSYSSDLFQLPSTGAFKAREIPAFLFRKYYDRGDFPIYLQSDTKGNSLVWKTDIQKLDYRHYLPLFFDGLSETKHPYSFFAHQGIVDMVRVGPDRILPILPLLIIPIKKALRTKNPTNILMALKVIKQMVTSCKGVGLAMVQFYRQILPTLNAFKAKNFNSGDEIEYQQRRSENLGDLIQETLECMEKYGGVDAFVNIKYVVPTYESCLFR